jgi:hypothetical protein
MISVSKEPVFGSSFGVAALGIFCVKHDLVMSLCLGDVLCSIYYAVSWCCWCQLGSIFCCQLVCYGVKGVCVSHGDMCRQHQCQVSMVVSCYKIYCLMGLLYILYSFLVLCARTVALPCSVIRCV